MFKKTFLQSVLSLLSAVIIALNITVFFSDDASAVQPADIWYVTCNFDANGNLTGYSCTKGGQMVL